MLMESECDRGGDRGKLMPMGMEVDGGRLSKKVDGDGNGG